MLRNMGEDKNEKESSPSKAKMISDKIYQIIISHNPGKDYKREKYLKNQHPSQKLAPSPSHENSVYVLSMKYIKKFCPYGAVFLNSPIFLPQNGNSPTKLDSKNKKDLSQNKFWTPLSHAHIVDGLVGFITNSNQLYFQIEPKNSSNNNPNYF